MTPAEERCEKALEKLRNRTFPPLPAIKRAVLIEQARLADDWTQICRMAIALGLCRVARRAFSEALSARRCSAAYGAATAAAMRRLND